MLLEKDQIEGLSEDQVTAIEAAYTVKEDEFKGLANKNADGIFNGAAQKLATLTGINKEEKEQYSAYFERLGTEWLPEASKGKITAVEAERDEWKGKFENHKGDETIKADLLEAQKEVAKIPDLLQAKETEWSDKYNTLEKTSNESKLNRSISDSMPTFDKNVNQFELEAKKKTAIDRIKQSHELSYDENGKLIGTKDYNKTLFSDLLKNDEELKDLVLIDQNAGGGGSGSGQKPTTLTIPKEMAKGAAQQLIKEYVITVEGIDHLDDKFSPRFKELCKENNVL
jgi:hypothetical protein